MGGGGRELLDGELLLLGAIVYKAILYFLYCLLYFDLGGRRRLRWNMEETGAWFGMKRVLGLGCPEGG